MVTKNQALIITENRRRMTTQELRDYHSSVRSYFSSDEEVEKVIAVVEGYFDYMKSGIRRRAK